MKKETNLSVEQIQQLIIKYEGGARANIFVPNVSWGYFKSHEADLSEDKQARLHDRV